MKEFVNLHTHSEFSVLDGANFVEDMASKAKELGFQALGLTDHGNLGGVRKFFSECKDNKIKPIIGMEAYFVEDRNIKDQNLRYYHLCVFAKNNKGYKNLLKLSTEAYKTGFYYKPRIDWDLLNQFGSDLIISGACLQGPVNYNLLNNNEETAKRIFKEFKDRYNNDFYLELMLHPESGDRKSDLPQKQKDLVTKLLNTFPNEQYIITNDAHYLTKDDSLAHEILLAIQTHALMRDEKRFRLDFPEFYLKTGDQIHDVFTQLGFNSSIVDKAFKNTVEIASKCEIDLNEIKGSYPKFTLPEGKTSNYDYFIELIKKGWQICNIPNTDEYRNRLKMEVEVFKKTGFIDYMLIVQDYVSWAQQQGIMLGMARGSASGSLVAYLLRIIDVDPVRHGLNFHRFMNPERVSPPDIDVDIQASRREEVKQYITHKYEGKVVNIGTYPALRSKGVVRDVCRVLEVPLNVQNEILEAIPIENDHEDASKQIKLKDAYKEYPEFKAVADKYPRLFKIIFRLEGLKKAEGVHASGVVISPVDITELVPLRINKEVLSTQFDAEDIEDLGLLKVDLLGLKMLDTAVQTLKLLDPEDNVVWSKIPENDPKTWGLICSGMTKGIFQLENPQMRKLLLDIHPKNIRDLATILALFRPGPARAGLVQEYIANRLNPHLVNFGHPGVKKVLEPTFNVMIFQEDLMQLTKELAGFTDGEADNFRRMVGKQKPDEMRQGCIDFENRCAEKGVPRTVTGRLVKQFQSAATYLFSLNHATAYAVLAYRVAYLKAHFPGKFAAAFVNVEGGDEAVLMEFLKEYKSRGFDIIPPEINKSEGETIFSKGQLILGLERIKFVGEGAALTIREKRANQPFSSFEEFVFRVRSRSVNKRVINALISGNCFRSLGYDKNELHKSFNQAEGTESFDVQDFLKNKTYDQIKQECLSCDRCELAKTKKQVVFGSGSQDAKVMIIGEAPGQDEDEQGIPFIGRSGQLLRKHLRDIGILDQIYITNIVRCRPPENRKPLAKEIRSCGVWRSSEIALVKPQIIIALGDTAYKTLHPEAGKITIDRGKWSTIEIDGVKYQFMATYHPSYVQRMQVISIENDFRNDLASIKQYLKEGVTNGS